MKLKTYGITLPVKNAPKQFIPPSGNTQQRCIVSATSQKRAAELLRIPLSYFRDMGCVTGNAEEIAHCEANPETVFYRPQHQKKFFKR